MKKFEKRGDWIRIITSDEICSEYWINMTNKWVIDVIETDRIHSSDMTIDRRFKYTIILVPLDDLNNTSTIGYADTDDEVNEILTEAME